jgi:hypothetical protein
MEGNPTKSPLSPYLQIGGGCFLSKGWRKTCSASSKRKNAERKWGMEARICLQKGRLPIIEAAQ